MIYIITYNYYDFTLNRVKIGGLETYIKDLALLGTELNKKVLVLQIAKGHGSGRNVEVDGVSVQEFLAHKSMLKSLNQVAFNQIYKKYNNDEALFIIASDMMNISSKASNVICIQHGIGFDIPGDMLQGFWKKYKITQHINKFIRCLSNMYRFYRTRNTVCVDYNYYNWFRTLGTIYPGSTMRVIPNYASKIISEEELINKLKRKDKIKKIIFARRFVDYRGTLLFANVIRRVLKKHSDIFVTFAGNGPLESMLKEMFNNDKRVSFTSFSPIESVKFHYDYDIAVVPTIYSEGTSLSLCESMAAGCFPIATHIGGITNLLFDGYNGFMTSPNEEELYESLMDVLELNVDDFNEIVKNAHSVVKNAFSADKWKKEWAKIIG